MAPRPEAIVDNGGAGYTATPDWTNVSGGYGGSYGVHLPTGTFEGITDNNSANTSSTGLWWTLRIVPTGYWGVDYKFAATSGAGVAFTWTVPLPSPGEYKVEVRWVVLGTNTTQARYTVSHLGGNTTTIHNQWEGTGGGKWQPAGTYYFGSTAIVTLDAPNGSMIADAVRVTRVVAPAAGEATWKAPDAATYQVQVRYPSNASYNPAATYTVVHGGGSTPALMNQTTNGNTWHSLGTFTFTDPLTQGVKLASDPNYAVAADAVRFIPTGSSTTIKTVNYVHTDQLNTPTKLTGQNQSIVWDAVAEPFGKTTLVVNAISNPLRFPGQYFDAETGLSQNWYRDYDPSLGRYSQSDPIGLAGGINTYSYVGGNPLRFTDPMGLKSRVCCKRLGATGLTASHCYIETVVNGVRSTTGLLGSWFSGEKWGTGNIYLDNGWEDSQSCGDWSDELCSNADECVKRMANEYANPSEYNLLLGPNSNTFAGTIARGCGLKKPSWHITPGWTNPPAPQKPDTEKKPPTQL